VAAESPATHVYQFRLRLYTGALAGDESGHPILTAGEIAMAALVVLAGRLPGDAKTGGDLRPPDAHVDRLIHQYREFGIRLLPGESGAFDLLQHLGWGQLEIPLRRVWLFRSCVGPPRGLYMPDFRLAFGPAHVLQHAGTR
jgi:hypothetical protein